MNESSKQVYRNLAKFKGVFESSNAFYSEICLNIDCALCEFDGKRPCTENLKTLQPDAIAFVRAEKLQSLLSS